MTPDFWWRKVSAFLHDPPAKADAMWYRSLAGRGHVAFGRALQELLESGETEEEQGETAPGAEAEPADTRAADGWMTGADRPNLGTRGQVRVFWRASPLATHPLWEAPLRVLARGNKSGLPPLVATEHILKRANDALEDELRSRRLPQEKWAEAAFWWLWRRFRASLLEKAPRSVDTDLWRRYLTLGPADTRSPDHSLWDHVRATSAIAWLETLPPPSGQEPHLLLLEVGPVGEMLREARTSRDLWVASMLLSEMSLAAMKPIIQRYGPDAILYPDLSGNRRFDRYLAFREEYQGLLSKSEKALRTRSSLIPNKWMAVLPQGTGEDFIDRVGEECRQAAFQRWREIALAVRDRFLRELPAEAPQRDPLGRQWTEQVEREGEGYVHWVAMPWKPALPPESAWIEPPPPQNLPGQPYLDETKWRETERFQRFSPWVGESNLRHYDQAGGTFFATRKNWMTGFDYALTQHALREALQARHGARTIPTTPAPPGEACTLCGHRPALGVADSSAPVDEQRRSSGKAWGELYQGLGWDSPGKERLCGVCATRRFLVAPWPERGGEALASPIEEFHEVWSMEKDRDSDNKLRLPFPSTAAIASAHFLVEVFRSREPQVVAARDHLAQEFKRIHWPETFFPRSLPAISLSFANEPLARYEPSGFHDDPRKAELDARRELFPKAPQGDDQEVKRAVLRLREAMGSKDAPHPPPPTRFAVLALDGDQLGRLLLGEGKTLKATWAQVLHPMAVNSIREKAGEADTFRQTDPWSQRWRSLLNQPRLMGPSLHAFINRALTTFANRIVPWVVEREYAGRLVYAGGDDVLALAPADDALPIAARLQQLWSAAWVMDTLPDLHAWSEEGAGSPMTGGETRKRFRVLGKPSSGHLEPDDPEKWPFDPHVQTGESPPYTAEGEIFPQLGGYQSLSAGIAYAHFKTPLGLVIQEARDSLKRAKGPKEGPEETKGRSSCGESLFTRNGVKLQSVFRWNGDGDGPLSMARTVMSLRQRFREGTLAGRLPYQLRGHREALRGVTGGERTLLVEGLVLGALSDAANEKKAAKELTSLWLEGLRRVEPERWEEDPGLGNLLLCRALAREEGE